MKPVLVKLVSEDGTHAAHLGDRVALCGACGRPLLKPVRSAFDVSCGTCGDQVVNLLGLTPLTDLGNVELRTVEEDQ